MIRYINSANDIYEHVIKLYKELNPNEPIRLIGIKMSELIDIDKHKNASIQSFF